MIPVVALVLVMGIQYGLFYLGVFPVQSKKLTAVHMFLIIVTQASVFLALLYFLQKKLGFTHLGFGDEISGKELFLGFAGLIGVNIISMMYMKLVGTFPDQFKDFNPELLSKNVYLFMFTVALLGPVYEEIVFRGYILGMLVGEETSLKKNTVAIIFTSLLFMFAHMDSLSENYFIGLPLFLLGAYFSFWAIRKKGVVLTIILHMSQNFLAALMMLQQIKRV